MSYSGSPTGPPGSPAYRKGVAFGQPGWRASRASRGRPSWIDSPLRQSSPSGYPNASPLLHTGSRGVSPSPSGLFPLNGATSGQRSPLVPTSQHLSQRECTDTSDHMNDDDTGTPQPVAPRKRFVRRRPILQRIQQWPFDLYYRITSSFFDIEEQIFADQAGNVFGGVMHLLAFLALFLSPESSLGAWFMNKPAYRQAQNPAIAYEYLVNHAGDEFAMADALKRHARKSAVYQASDSFFRVISIFLFVTVLIISGANAYSFFTKRRTYKFYDQPKQQSQLGGVTNSGFDSPSIQRKHGIRQLAMWDPSAYSANLFATFSPAHAIVYPAAVFVRMGPFSWLVFTFLLAFISVPVHLILYQYQQLVKDKGVVQAAVLTEYNEKYVYPKAMPVVRDQSTQTM